MAGDTMCYSPPATKKPAVCQICGSGEAWRDQHSWDVLCYDCSHWSWRARLLLAIEHGGVCLPPPVWMGSQG